MINDVALSLPLLILSAHMSLLFTHKGHKFRMVLKIKPTTVSDSREQDQVLYIATGVMENHKEGAVPSKC